MRRCAGYGWPEASCRRSRARRAALEFPLDQITRPGTPPLATRARPARYHAVTPPSRFSASNPLRRRPLAARSLREPLRHTATTIWSLGTSARRDPSSPRGMCCAPSMCPASHSSCSRTSRRCSSERRLLTSCGNTFPILAHGGDMDSNAMRERLERERADLASTAERMKERLAVAQIDSGGDVALADQHPADTASETEARVLDLARQTMFEASDRPHRRGAPASRA